MIYVGPSGIPLERRGALSSVDRHVQVVCNKLRLSHAAVHNDAPGVLVCLRDLCLRYIGFCVWGPHNMPLLAVVTSVTS